MSILKFLPYNLHRRFFLQQICCSFLNSTKAGSRKIRQVNAIVILNSLVTCQRWWAEKSSIALHSHARASMSTEYIGKIVIVTYHMVAGWQSSITIYNPSGKP
jgi:hypothetical protein